MPTTTSDTFSKFSLVPDADDAAGVQRGARARAVQGRAWEGAGRASGAGRARRAAYQRAGGDFITCRLGGLSL